MNLLIQKATELVKQGDEFLKKHGPSEFHSKASDLLASADCHLLYDYQNLIIDSLSNDWKLEQNFSQFEFSDLPLTIARGEECFIDIYFWRRRSTVIHNHHFSGAFQCLTGLNSDIEFQFEYQKKIGHFHGLGKIEILHQKNISPGEIQPIAPLDGFIHQNHHHADLTVNLCFRTPQMKNESITNYLYTGLYSVKNLRMLERAERLWRFTQLEKFDFKKVFLDLDDAIYFLIMTSDVSSQNTTYNELRKYLSHKISSEADLDIENHLKQHHQELDRLMEESN